MSRKKEQTFCSFLYTNGCWYDWCLDVSQVYILSFWRKQGYAATGLRLSTRWFGASRYAQKRSSACLAMVSGSEKISSSASLVGSTTPFCRILPGSCGSALRVFTNADHVERTTLPTRGVGMRSADATSPALLTVFRAHLGISLILSRNRTNPSLPSFAHLPSKVKVFLVARSRTTYLINCPVLEITGQIKKLPIILAHIPSHLQVSLVRVLRICPRISIGEKKTSCLV